MDEGKDKNSQRIQSVKTFFVLFGFTFFSGSMVVGQQMAAVMSFHDFVTSVLIGGGILGLFGGALAAQGSRLYSDLFSMSKPVFGESGKKIVCALIIVSQIGWFGVGTVMFSDPISKYLGFDDVQKIAVGSLIGILMIGSAYGGVKYITRVSYLAVPVILLFGLVAIYIAANSMPSGVGTVSVLGDGYDNIPVGISLVIGTYIAGAVTVPNFTEKNDSPWFTGMIAFLAFSLGNGIMLCFGAASYYLIGGSDIFDIFNYFGLLGLGIIVLGLNIWSSCDNGLYSAALGLKNLTGTSMKVTVPVCGLTGIVLSRFIYEHLMQFLVLMNHIFPPIGITLILRNILRSNDCRQEEVIHITSIMAVLTGTIASFVMRGGIESLNGILVSVLVLFVSQILMKIIMRKKCLH